MALQKDSTYGFVGHDDVEEAIEKRLQALDTRKPEKVSQLLAEAAQALLSINSAIPVQSRHRHLVAQALEKFADGPESQDPHQKP